MRFQVRALGPDNLVQQLVIEALDLDAARRHLDARQLKPLAIKPLPKAGWTAGRQARPFSLILFSQELLALLEAGLSLVESIEALAEKELSTTTRLVLDGILGNLREGLRFSAALGRQPEVFPPLYVGIVQAAEGTSDLPKALTRYVEYQSRLDSVRNRMISAAIYPSILLTVGSAVTFFLLGYVVPRFASVYQGTGRSLPWLSQLLLSWGEFVSAHVQLMIALLLTLLLTGVFGLRHLIRTGYLMTFVGQLPGIGERIRILELSRLYLTLGMLLEGGLSILVALDMVAGTLSPKTRAGLMAARLAISEGNPLSEAFEGQMLTTPIAIRMLRVGERSGQLGTMLMRSALFYEGETQRWLERFVKTFEPLLMAGIGLIIGLIVVLLYMPIFDLAGTLQ